MKNQKWLYKIGDYSMGLLPLTVMLALISGLTVYLYIKENAAFFFTGFISLIFLAVFIVSVTRALCVKFLVGEKGFYYQTKPNNGKFYRYTDIKNAWVSTGASSNGFESQFFNFETADAVTIRVPIRGIDSEATEYILDRVESTPFYGETREIDEKTKTYEINGKTLGKNYIGIAIGIMIIGIVMQIPAFLYLRTSPLTIFFGVLFLVSLLCVVIWFILRYKFFKVRIEASGFYYQTTPFNGKFYRYSEIKRCKAVKKLYRTRSHTGTNSVGTTQTHYAYYFVFTDKGGKTQRFRFEKEMYEREIDVLIERIQSANNPDYYQQTAYSEIENKTYRHPYSERYEKPEEDEYAQDEREAGYEYNLPQNSPQAKVGNFLAILFSVAFIGMAIYFAVTGIQNYKSQLPNAEWGDAKATVITALPYIGPTEEDRENEVYVYDITYEYEVDGKTYKGYVEGSRAEVMGGETCDIKYNPQAPEESVIPTTPNKSSLYMTLGMAGLFAFFAVWRIVASVKRIIKINKFNKENMR